MKFTFGIVTIGDNKEQIDKCIYSITKQIDKDNYEIIIIGGENIYDGDIIHIPFDETIKKAWITKKKNLLSQYGKYENVVLMHDYIMLKDDWYEGFLNFGNDWDICMNRVHDIYDRRFYDWINWDSPKYPQYYPLDYNYIDSSNTFVPGAYWVAKKELMLKEPLNESLVGGESEDIEWSLRVRDKYSYVFNEQSTVIHTKKHRGFDENIPMAERY